jgi:hypothetical protein
MDHMQFKANQTGARYVARDLDDHTMEIFELHLMGCVECVEEVELWRAIKLDMPKGRPEAQTAASQRKTADHLDWRMAASLVGAGFIGAVGGWVGKASTATTLDSTQTVVFNLPSVSRGADECSVVRLAPDTRVALLRVPGLSRDAHIVALDSEQRAIPSEQYTSRIQPDGSQLLRVDSSLLISRTVHLILRASSGSTDLLGCVTGEIVDLKD